jgi:hypothetical protein
MGIVMPGIDIPALGPARDQMVLLAIGNTLWPALLPSPAVID